MKKLTVRVLPTVLLMVAAVGVQASSAGAENLQLAEDVMPQLKPLLERAMQQSPKVLDRNLDLVFAEADGYMARASSLPSVGGHVSYQKQYEDQVNVNNAGAGDKFYYNFSINQAVWHWGALQAARQISRIDRDLAAMNYGEAYRALAVEIRSAYLGLVMQKMALRNVEYSARLAKANLDRQQARYSVNQITYGEIMTHQLRVDETSLAMRRAKADLEFALSSFRSLSGDASLREADVPDGIGDLTQTPVVASVVAGSSAESSEAVQMAEKEVEKAKLGRVGPRYGLFPKLGLVAGVTRDENTRDIKVDVNGLETVQPYRYQVDTVYFGVQMNWNIFDGMANKGQRLAALTRLRRAEQRLATLRLTVERSLERERANVGFTWDAYQVAQMRLRMARENLAHQQQEAGRGLVSQEQIDAVQGDVFSNQYFAQAALSAHLNAVAQYLSSKGMDPVGRSAVLGRTHN